MAGATAALMIKVAANSYEFNRAMETVSKKMQNVGRDMQRMGKNMSMYFTAPLAAIAAISVKEYDMAARSAAKVEQAIKSTGGAAKLSFKQLADFASQLQSKTIFGDDDILNKSTAQLLTFTNIAGENFKRAQRAALDLSTVLDGDLQSASMQLGKALNDPVRSLSALRKSGIQFSTEQETVIKKLAQTGQIAKAQSMMLDELERQYGGQAEARAKEGAGYLIQLKNKWGDFLEQIGKAIMPALNALASMLSGVVDWLSGLSEGTKTWIVTIGALVAALGPTLLIIGKLCSMAPLLSKGFGSLTNTVTLTIAAIGLLLITLNKLSRAKQETIDRFADQRQGKGIWTVENFDKAEADYEKQITTINNLKSKRSALRDQMKGLNVLQMGQAYTLGNQIGEMDKEIEANENLAAAKHKLLEELREQKKQTIETSVATGDLKSQLSEIGVDIDSLSEKTPKATGLIAKLGEQIEKLEKAKANANSVSGIVSLNSQIEALKKQVDDLNSITAEYLATRAKWANFKITGAGFTVIPKINIASPIKPVIDSEIGEISKSLQQGLGQIGNAEFSRSSFDKLISSFKNGGINAAKSMAAALTDVMQVMKSGMNNLMTGMLSSIGEGLVSVFQGGSLAEALGGILSNISSLIGQFIIQLGVKLLMASTIMQQFMTAIETWIVANPWLAAGIAIAMIAAGAAISATLKSDSSAGVPKLAKGGLAYGPTYAMVGDNVGANVDPEVIAPLSKLKGIMGGGGAANINLRISGKLTASGRDLALQLSKENYKFQVMGQ